LRVAISVSDAARVGMHSDEVTVSLATVRELVDEQFPEWRGLPVWEPSSQGAVNAIVRIGEQFAARFPCCPRTSR
jgi:aminoglycoside phosphotransferase (APT) family kinase protein